MSDQEDLDDISDQCNVHGNVGTRKDGRGRKSGLGSRLNRVDRLKTFRGKLRRAAQRSNTLRRKKETGSIR